MSFVRIFLVTSLFLLLPQRELHGESEVESRRSGTSCGHAFSVLGTSALLLSAAAWLASGPPPVPIETQPENQSFASTFGNDLAPSEQAVVLLNEGDLGNMFPEENDNRCHGIVCTSYGVLRHADYSLSGKETKESVLNKIQKLTQGKRATFHGISGPQDLYSKFPNEIREVIEKVQRHQPAARLNMASLTYYDDLQRRFPIAGKVTRENVAVLEKRLNHLPETLSPLEYQSLSYQTANWKVGLASGEPHEFVGVAEATLEELILSNALEKIWRSLPSKEREEYQRQDALTLKSWIDIGLSPSIGIQYPKSSHAIRVVGYVRSKDAEVPSGFYIYDPNYPKKIRLALALRKDEKGQELWVFDNREEADARIGEPNVTEFVVPVNMIWHPKGIQTLKVDGFQNRVIQIQGR